jgi:DNA-directed RNA polymerase subunit M/transcription elongation factor TFIIS
MEFCSVCDNMLYYKVGDGENTLIKYCKNCNYIDKHTCEEEAIILIDNNMGADEQYYKQFKSKYIEYDPTLPRVNNISCKNEKCPRKDPQENEVIYIKYDHMNMKYLYYCTHCKEFWRK